jgi:hypothetical protein
MLIFEMKGETSLVTVLDKRRNLSNSRLQSESDLESAINQVKAELFGEHLIYLDVKKKIGAKAGLRRLIVTGILR